MTTTQTATQTQKPRKLRNPLHWVAKRDRYIAQAAKLSDQDCAAAKAWLNSTFFGA